VGGLPILEQGVVSGPSLWEGSCGGLGPEAVFSWTAPQDGYYIFDTKSSSVDTVLYLKTGGCYGLEVGCDDDIAPGTLSSEIRRFLSAGETVTIFVDSFNSGGSYQLNISQ